MNDIKELLKKPAGELNQEELETVRIELSRQEEETHLKKYYVIEGIVKDDWIAQNEVQIDDVLEIIEDGLVSRKDLTKVLKYIQRTLNKKPSIEKGTVVYSYRNDTGGQGYWFSRKGKDTYLTCNDVKNVKKSKLKITDIKWDIEP